MTKITIELPIGVKILAILELLKTPIIFIILPIEVEWPWMGAGLMAFSLGGYNLVVGWGLWHAKKWAYWGALILAILSIVIFVLYITGFYFITLFVNPTWWIIDAVLTLLFDIRVTDAIMVNIMVISQLIAPIIILYYLIRSRIKEVFGSINRY